MVDTVEEVHRVPEGKKKKKKKKDYTLHRLSGSDGVPPVLHPCR